MNLLNDLIGGEATARLGWVLVHFLWQGAFLAALLTGVLAVGKRCTAQARYVTAYAALVMAAIVPVATWMWLAPDPSIGREFRTIAIHQGTTAAPRAPASEFDPQPLDPNVTEPMTLEAFLAPLVLAWAAGVVILALYRAGGWIYLQHLRRCSQPAPQAELRNRLERLQHVIGISRAVRILYCPRIDSPAVIGVIKPAILLPLGCVLNLMPQQLEAILAHELAHVRRHDYLLNLIQTAIETLLFFHPAIWWMSRRIRIERENACDDIGVRAVNDRVAYADALARLEELRAARTPPAPALAAHGGPLLARVRRVLLVKPPADRATWWPAAGVAAMIIAALVSLRSTALLAADPTAQPSASVTCVDEAGTPIEGAEVYFFGHLAIGSEYQPLIEGPVQTDRSGTARLPLPAGASIDRGSIEVYARVPQKLAGLASMFSPDYLGGKPLTQPGKLVMHPARTLHGRLIAPDGIKRDALRVTLLSMINRTGPDVGGAINRRSELPIRDGWPELFEFRVNADGTFSVPDVPEDASVTLIAAGGGAGFAVFSGPLRGAARRDVDLSANLTAEGVIEGSLRYQQAGDRRTEGTEVVAKLQPHSGTVTRGVSLRTTVGADGRFRFTGLHRGIYTIDVPNVPPGFELMPALVRVVDGETTEAKLVFEEGVIVQGKVIAAADGKPLAGAQIAASPSNLYAASAPITRSEKTTASGEFSMRLPSGKIKLSVIAPEGFQSHQGIDVELHSGQANLPHLQFRLEPWKPTIDDTRREAGHGALKGRAIDPKGKPLANVTVLCKPRMRHRPDGDFWVHIAGRTDAEGRYEFKSLDAGIEHMVSVPNWSTSAADSKIVTIERDETIELEDLVVTPRQVASVIEGIVVDADGKPVNDASVSLDHVDSMRTGTDGRFRFDGYDVDVELEISAHAESYDRGTLRGVRRGTKDARIVMKPKEPGAPLR